MLNGINIVPACFGENTSSVGKNNRARVIGEHLSVEIMWKVKKEPVVLKVGKK